MARRLGQHFLVSPKVVERIIEAAGLSAADTVLEIGPGKGVLTRALAERAGRVVAVEKDTVLAAVLKKEFVGSETVKIVAADIRDCLESVTNNQLLVTSFKVVANIPYYLTSRLIRLLLEHEPPPGLIVLMLQREVAERIVAKPPHMNLLALSVEFYGKPEIIARVQAGAFQPPPKVESAIIRIRPYISITADRSSVKEIFFKLIRAGFAQKRKTLLNNLAQGLESTKDKALILLKAAAISPERRAETLSLEDWLALTRTYIKLYYIATEI